jgi:hypothetical protein
MLEENKTVHAAPSSKNSIRLTASRSIKFGEVKKSIALDVLPQAITRINWAKLKLAECR